MKSSIASINFGSFCAASNSLASSFQPLFFGFILATKENILYKYFGVGKKFSTLKKQVTIVREAVKTGIER